MESNIYYIVYIIHGQCMPHLPNPWMEAARRRVGWHSVAGSSFAAAPYRLSTLNTRACRDPGNHECSWPRSDREATITKPMQYLGGAWRYEAGKQVEAEPDPEKIISITFSKWCLSWSVAGGRSWKTGGSVRRHPFSWISIFYHFFK